MLQQHFRTFMTRWTLRMRRHTRRLQPRVSIISIKPRLQEIEDRIAPALIAPTPSLPTVVLQNGTAANGGNTIGGQTTDYSNISVVAHPTAPAKQIMVAQGLRADGVLEVVAQFSTDSGVTWTTLPGSIFNTRVQDPSAPFNPNGAQTNFRDASQASVTIGRDGIAYIAFLEHNAARSAGVVLVASFDFSGVTPTLRNFTGRGASISGFSSLQALYRWSNNQDVASYPTVAVDNNLPTFTEPGGGTIVDTMVNAATGRPKAVYVAWGTLGTVPTAQDVSVVNGVTQFNPTAIFTSVSADQGNNFSSPIAVNGNSVATLTSGNMAGPNTGYYANVDSNRGTTFKGGNAPVIAFSPANSSAPGRAVLSWAEASATAGAKGLIHLDITQPDNGIAAQTAGSVATFFNDTDIPITDASLPPPPPPNSPTVTDHISKQTTSTITIDASTLSARGLTTTDIITNLTTTVSIAHPNLGEVSAVLSKPGFTDVVLFNNRIPVSGTVGGNVSPFNQPRGLVSPPGPPSPANAAPTLGMGRSNDGTFGTTFDDYAARRITDPANTFPYIGNYKAENWGNTSGSFGQFVGRTVDSLIGSWTLTITDFRSQTTSPPTVVADQFIDYFAFTVTAGSSKNGANPGFTPGLGTDQNLAGTLDINGKQTVPVNGIGAFTNPNTTNLTPAASGGIGPGLSIAFDTAINPYNDGTALFGRASGLLHVAYTRSTTTASSDYNVFLNSVSIDPATNTLIQTLTPTRVNDDTANDNFSEGNRMQLAPTVAVDPSTGYVGVMWYDARYDAGNVRAATYFALSNDGGATFSQTPNGGITPGSQVYLNSPRTGTDLIKFAATGGDLAASTSNIEPIPTNIAQIGGLGLGIRQSLLVTGPGQFSAYWTGNVNATAWKGAGVTNQNSTATGSSLFRNTITGAAGPRLVDGDMGPVTNATGFNTDSKLNGFVVTFDRAIDVNTFTANDIVIQFRSAYSPLGAAPVILVPGVDYANPQPLNASGVGGRGASFFLIRFLIPQTGIGTYSYTVGPDVRDLFRTPTIIGNKMDQNNDGTTNNSTLDVFAAPGPDRTLGNTTPFVGPYDPITSPLIITGPRFASSTVVNTVAGQTASADNLVLNAGISAIDVTFDRAMDPTTFESDGRDIIRISGPTGNIFDKAYWDTTYPGKPYPVSVASVNGTTYRVSFPTQVLSGNYNIEFGSDIKDTLGNLLDNNKNAGLDILRGGASPTTGAILTNNYTTTSSIAIAKGATTELPLVINDTFSIVQTLNDFIQLKVNITFPNDPDLFLELVAPDGTVVRLATSVGKSGTQFANFTNTLFTDNGVTPIQQGLAPFNTGPYTAQFPLSAFRGRSSNGTWRLRVINNGNSTGTINSFTLSLPFVVTGTGMGEAINDRFTVPFRIFTADATNAQTKQVWTPVGPAPTNAQDNTSRITGVAVDPSDPTGNTVYTGGASGGLWKTTNFLTQSSAGPNWIPLTDFGTTYALNTGNIAVFGRNNDPNQSIIFALTGEGDTGSAGVGVLRSMDGGRTWVVLDSTNNFNGTTPLAIDSNLRDRRFFGSTGFKIIVDPTATPTGDVIVYMALSGTSGGVWRSTDTGRTWKLIRAGNATDVFLAAGSRSTSNISSGALEFLYAAFAGDGIYTSPQATTAASMAPTTTAQGNPLIRDFTIASKPVEVTVNAPAGTPNGAKGRIQIVGPAATGDVLQDTFYAGWLYAVVSTPASTLDGVYMTKDFGRNWTKVRIPVFDQNTNGAAGTPTAFPTNNETRVDHDPFIQSPGIPGQGNYDIAIEVDPTNPNVFYVCGVGGAGIGPARGLIRIDISQINDPQSFNSYDNSSASQTGTLNSTVGGITVRDTSANGYVDPFVDSFGAGNVFNLSRDASNPFLANSTVSVENAKAFTNTGENTKYAGFTAILTTADMHRLVVIKDPVSGKARLLGTGDHQIFTGVDDGSGNLLTGIGLGTTTTGIGTDLVFGTRNGNLQLLQEYSGAAQPSQLAVDLAGAFFYGMAQDNGFPISRPDVLTTGNLEWSGSKGDGAGVAVDATGSGTAYQYRWPCCNGGAGSATDFFYVLPPGTGQGDGISRTNGLLQAGDDPQNNKGQWPLIADVGYFTVNPVDPNGIILGSAVGRIFRTTNQGKNWNVVAEPNQLDNSYARATAFGAPDPATPGQLNNFLYVGTSSGNVFVTFTGGAPWTNISTGIAGNGAIEQIITSPQRGSKSAYAITSSGVFFLADATVGNWVQITGTGGNSISGNLFGLRDATLGDRNNEASNPVPNSTVPFAVRGISSITADWRYAIPTDPLFPTKNTFPILYVGTYGGVYRSLNNGATWEAFPGQSTLVDPATGLALKDPETGADRVVPRGGWLPNVNVTDLDLSLGNIDPLTGYPQQKSGGFNMLTASTYGRGTWSIRLEDPASVAQYNVLFQSGPRVVGLAADTSSSLLVNFDAAVDPLTVNISDFILTNAAGTVIPITSVVSVANIQGGVDRRNLFRVNFTPINTADTYTITIGPKIYDFAGFGMNQNSDKTNGDLTFSAVTGAAVDAYTGKFSTVVGTQKGNLFVDMPTTARAGDPVTVTVTAIGINGLPTTNYTGTVSFATSDGKISIGDGLPSNYTFLATDQGTHTFAVFFRTSTYNPPSAPTSLTVTDTNPTGLGAATQFIVVRGGAATVFSVSGVTSPTAAGTARDITVTAIDQFGNIADAFTGDVAFSSSDPLVVPGNGLPLNFTFTAGNNGSATILGLVALKTAGVQSVTATDVLSGAVTGKQTGIIVTPDVAKTLTVSGQQTPITAGTLGNITVVANDKYGNIATSYSGTVSFTSTDILVTGGNGLPANYTFVAGDNGQHTFANGTQLKTAGTQSITATDTTTASITGKQSNIVVVAAPASKFLVQDVPSPTIAGTKQTFNVYAADPYGNRSNNYTGTVSFSSTDPLIGPGNGLPNAYTFVPSDSGKRTFTLGAQFKTVGTQTLTATDASNNFTGVQTGIVVTASNATQISLSGFPNPATAGTAGTFVVTARDTFGNIATNYLGTVRFSSSDAAVSIGNGLPTNYTFTAADQGVHSFSKAATLRTAGLQTLTATDTATGSITGSQTGILVIADVAAKMTLSGYASPTQAGSSNSFSVVATDRFGNLATTYQGTVQFSSSDLQVAANKGLPSFYTFTPADGGKHTFTASLKTAGTQTLTVTDIVTPTVTGTQTGIVVTAGSLSRLTVGGYPSPVIAGLSTGISVAASDAYGNPVSNFTGTISFSTSDPQGVVPSAYTFLPTDNGRKTFSSGFILKTAGLQSVTATSTTNSALTGTQSNINVFPTDAVSFVVLNFPSPITAGTEATFTVQARDPYGNLATGYNGSITLTSSDVRAIISTPITLTGGVGTGTVTFRTAGTQSLTATDTANTSLTSTQGNITVDPAAPGTIPPPIPTPLDLTTLTAVGSDAGVASVVRVLNPDGTVRNEFNPYDPGFLGGARVALLRTPTGARVAVAPGAGRFPDVRVVDLKTGDDSFRIQPFETEFTGGVFVTSGDLNGDGYDDIIMSPDSGGGPRVVVVDGKTGNRIVDFFGIDDSKFRGGARVAVSDINGDGVSDLIVAAGIGGGPRIAIYDGNSVLTGIQRPTRLLPDFFAFEPELRNGAYVAAGDIDNDGAGDVIFGAGPGGGPRVRIVSGDRLLKAQPFSNLDIVPQVQIANFFAGDIENRGGIRVTAKKLDGDNLADVVVGGGPGSGTKVTAYTGSQILSRVNPAELWSFDNDPAELGGVFVG